jgi:hypothetical protein
MKPYGYRWRTRTRPAILAREGHRCRRCRAAGRLDVAHVDGDNTHDEDANLEALCRLCHRRLDYPAWRAKSHWTRAVRKDRARPLLEMAAI